jgi:hypothetical protein
MKAAEIAQVMDEAEDELRLAVAQLVAGIDELLAATAGHQVIAASEVADSLLDLRIRATGLAGRIG